MARRKIIYKSIEKEHSKTIQMKLDERDDCTVILKSLCIRYEDFSETCQRTIEEKFTTYKISNLRVGAIRHL